MLQSLKFFLRMIVIYKKILRMEAPQPVLLWDIAQVTESWLKRMGHECGEQTVEVSWDHLYSSRWCFGVWIKQHE